jgi:hypothetical protein
MKPASLSIDSMPAWVLAEMPPGYQNRVAEIQRLASDLEAMNRFGRLLCDTGPDLAESVRSVLASLDLPTSAIEGASESAMCVRLRAGRVFLLASPSETPLQKKSADVAAAFQILQEHADEHDRVVIVVNPESGTPLTERGEAMTQDAAVFLKRMSIAVSRRRRCSGYGSCPSAIPTARGSRSNGCTSSTAASSKCRRPRSSNGVGGQRPSDH